MNKSDEKPLLPAFNPRHATQGCMSCGHQGFSWQNWKGLPGFGIETTPINEDFWVVTCNHCKDAGMNGSEIKALSDVFERSQARANRVPYRRKEMEAAARKLKEDEIELVEVVDEIAFIRVGSEIFQIDAKENRIDRLVQVLKDTAGGRRDW